MKHWSEEELRSAVRSIPLSPDEESAVQSVRSFARARGFARPLQGGRSTFLKATAFAAAAMVLLGFAVVNLKLLGDRHPHTPAPATIGSPSPGTSPTAFPPLAPVAGPIPSGRPVILYRRQGASAGTLSGASWTGARYEIEAAAPQALESQSADGAKLLVGSVVHGVVSGNDTQLSVNTAFAHLKWADDSTHLCYVAPDGSPPSATDPHARPANVFTILPGSAPVRLAQLGSIGFQAATVTILACSIASDRVVLAQVGINADTEDVWAVRISTGAIEGHTTYPAVTKTKPDGVIVRASPDGRYIAELDTADANTTVRSLPGLAVVQRLTGREVVGFSSNADLLITNSRAANLSTDNTSFADTEVIDRRTGAVVWSAPAGIRFFGRYLPEPGGDRLALSLNICPSMNSCLEDLWIVSRSGPALQIDRSIRLEG